MVPLRFSTFKWFHRVQKVERHQAVPSAIETCCANKHYSVIYNIECNCKVEAKIDLCFKTGIRLFVDNLLKDNLKSLSLGNIWDF